MAVTLTTPLGRSLLVLAVCLLDMVDCVVLELLDGVVLVMLLSLDLQEGHQRECGDRRAQLEREGTYGSLAVGGQLF